MKYGLMDNKLQVLGYFGFCSICCIRKRFYEGVNFDADSCVAVVRSLGLCQLSVYFSTQVSTCDNYSKI